MKKTRENLGFLAWHLFCQTVLEVTAGFEPADNGVADRGLTTWLRHHKKWSGLRGSNPPPRPWQGRALPNELNPRFLW